MNQELVTHEEISEKQKAWDAMAKRIDRTVDGLGYRMDENIKEAVIALNMLNINTSASCEGHLDRGNGGPWVRIEPAETPEMKSLEEKMIPLRRQVDEREEKEKEKKFPSAELEELWDELRILDKELETYHLEEIKKIMALLSEFYKKRKVDYDQMLIMDVGRASSHLQSQGIDLQAIAVREEKEKNLIRYRQEMQVFTDFLKEKYFQS